VGLYRGKPLEEYSKEELIEIINHLCAYYEDRIENLHKGLNILGALRRD